MKIKPPLEKEIQLVICDYLERKKYFFWRQNTNPIFNKESGKFRSMPKYALNGVPDIILVKDGVFLGLEVKRPTGHQSDVQKLFQNRLEQAGGRYFLVTSLDDVLKLGL